MGEPGHGLDHRVQCGKNIPDITELGNTDTPTQAARGMLAPPTST